MTLEHAAVLKSYSIHKTWHRAGTYSWDTKHLPNQNMYTQNKLHHKHIPGTCIHFPHTLQGILHARVPGTCSGYEITTNTDNKHSSGKTSQGLVAAVNSCFVHIRRAVACACIGGAQQGQHQIAYIHLQLQPLHVPGT